jgi:hypothetical protein
MGFVKARTGTIINKKVSEYDRRSNVYSGHVLSGHTSVHSGMHRLRLHTTLLSDT